MNHRRLLSVRARFAVLAVVTAFTLNGATSFAATAVGVPSAVGPQSAGVANLLPAQHAQDAHAQTIRITEAAGTVEYRSTDSDAWHALKSGDTLKPTDVIRTGENSSARVEFDGRIRMQILESSELTIEEARRNGEKNRQTLLRLDIGKIRADVDKLEADSTFKIKTPTAVSAVRGTVLYLDVVRFAQGLAGIVTSLYVDHGKVDFSSLSDEINAVLVEAFHTSSIDGDGGSTGSRELTEAERGALIQAFENAIRKSGGNPQFGVESGPIPGGNPGGPNTPNPALTDAIRNLINNLIETRNENQGIDDDTPGTDDDSALLGALKLTAFLLSEGVTDSGDFDYDLIGPDGGKDLGIVTDERGSVEDADSLLGGALASTTVPQVLQKIADLQAIRDAEKRELRDSLDSILDNQEFLRRDADQERTFDAQTGKVFTDVHGNRVRTDQYIYHEAGTDTVSFLSLTLRTGEYQNGVTSFRFATQFNQPLPEGTVLRDLPWNDYLNVVTQDDLEGRLISEDLSDLDDDHHHRRGRGRGHGDDDEYQPEFSQYDQYIVHSTSVMPELYPQSFLAEFQNPTSDRITVTEGYTDPYSATFLSDNDNVITRWMQGLERSGLEISQFDGVTISRESISSANGRVRTTTVIDGREYSSNGDNGSDGAEEGGLTDYGDLTDPSAIAAFVDSEDHPAFFEETFRDVQRVREERKKKKKHDDDEWRTIVTDYALYGAFLPIDNEGQILEAPGFQIEGIRDLVRPNTDVNGGNYNLETILSFGRNGEEGFVEDFRIDAIITPEIFGHYGIGGEPGLVLEENEDDVLSEEQPD